MKIGIISDTHGYAAPWKTTLEKYFSNVDLIIHCGDVLYHGPRNPIINRYDPANLAKLINDCKIPILICKGNCDAEVDQMVIKWPIISPYVFFQDNNIRILALHGQNLENEGLAAIGKQFNANIVVSGHTHVNKTQIIDNITLFNPGSVSLPKENSGASCAIYEDGIVHLIDINSGNELSNFNLC